MPVLFAAAEPNFAAIAIGVLGGLALFLFGMSHMTDALKHPEKKNYAKYKWWVTPVNLIIISGFLFIIDFATGPPARFIDWAYWPTLGFLMVYLLNTVVVRKPELAWFVGPVFFFLLSIFLLVLDLAYGENNKIWFMDWAPIPIGALLTFGTLIPIIVQLGIKKKPPKVRLEELESKIQNQNSQ